MYYHCGKKKLLSGEMVNKLTTILICSVYYTLYIMGCSKITDFFADGVTGSLYIREHCCKVSVKNNDRYPPANAILCLHLNNSTSKLRSNTWLSPTRFLKVNDCFQLFYDKPNKLLRYGEFSILL